MLKVIGNDAWEGSLWTQDEPRVSLIKYSSKGLVGSDKRAFTKRASGDTSAELLAKVDSLDVKPGEELMHLIALGTTEAYGPNRNGDGFKTAACKQYHHTFVDEGHLYRNHKNTDPNKSYGIVKASAFNAPMSRVELIVSLNSNKDAANANHGLVADKEMEKLAAGEDIPVSMACRVPFDVCSFCGNKAHTREEYCKGIREGGRCKAGGLYHNMGKTASVNGKLHQLHADNTEPIFFDISHVFVPADRIAYTSGLLKKSASWETGTGIELAEHWRIQEPELGMGYTFSDQTLKTANLLTDAVNRFHSNKAWQKSGSFWGVYSNKLLSNTNIPKMYKTGSVLKALQDINVCLSPTQFVQLFGNSGIEKAAELGEIIAPLSNEQFSQLPVNRLTHNPYTPALSAPYSLYKWAYAQQLPTFAAGDFLKQAALSVLEDVPQPKFDKAAIYALQDNPDIQDLATQYALYKVAFVENLPDTLKDSAADLLVARDYMSF